MQIYRQLHAAITEIAKSRGADISKGRQKLDCRFRLGNGYEERVTLTYTYLRFYAIKNGETVAMGRLNIDEASGFDMDEDGSIRSLLVCSRILSSMPVLIGIETEEAADDRDAEDVPAVPDDPVPETRGIHLDIYTDGGCRMDYKYAGGWAYIIVANGKKVGGDSGGEFYTTNNRMELTAAIEAIKGAAMLSPSSVTIFTDSQYLRNGAEIWYRNWLNPDGSLREGVKNPDMWKTLLDLKRKSGFPVTFEWVRGHMGNKWNEHCDGKATEEIEGLIQRDRK